jgi:squalene synthase HpnC
MTWNFQRELDRLGPGVERPAPSRAASQAYCRAVATSHYENFHVASLLLPRHLLPHFHAVYAYCRWADDLADESGRRAPQLLAWWRGQLHRMYQGEANHPVFVALGHTVRAFGIPPGPFLDLLDAFEQDQKVHRYESHAQLLAYSSRSANPVGRIVLHLWECHGDESGKLSDLICTGLQEANFWQDVRHDLGLGRVYIPQEDLRAFGVSEDALRGPATSEFREMMRHLCQRTRSRLEAGAGLAGVVPPRFRAEVGLFVGGGRAALDAIARAGYDVLSSRPVVSRWRKGALLLNAAWRKCLRFWGAMA